MAEDLARHEALETADDLRLALPLRGAASGAVDGGSVGAHAHDDRALLRLAAREPHLWRAGACRSPRTSVLRGRKSAPGREPQSAARRQMAALPDASPESGPAA